MGPRLVHTPPYRHLLSDLASKCKMSPVKWGILGASNIAFDFTQALRTLPADEHEVVAVGSTSLERCKEFCKDLGIPKSYGSYEELCADNEVEAVYVAAYTNRHAKLIELAVNHGKPCLCETTICENLEELQRVGALAREKGVLVMEALWTRFLPAWEETLKMIREGKIGEVKALTVTCGLQFLETLERVRSVGGGIMLEAGAFLFNVMDMVFGGEEPLKITGTGHKFESGVDHTVAINVLYSGNKIASLLLSSGVDLPNDAVVCGTKGTITVKSFWCSTELETPDGPKQFPFPPTEQPLKYLKSTGMRYEIAAFGDYIKNKKLESDVMPLATSERILGWMDEIRTQMGCPLS